jgi:tetratricopeptide (TPR) repeat protein
MNRKWTEEDTRWLAENQSRMDPLALSKRLKAPLAEVERRLREMAAGHEAAAKRTPVTLKEATREQTAARKEYEKGIDLFRRKSLGEAAKAFEDLIENHPDDKELTDRARTYLAACRNGKKAAPSKAPSKAELFYAAVYQKNLGNLGRAFELLRQAGDGDPDGRVPYLTACCHALAGEPELAVSSLKKAISLNRENRIHAKLEGDLASLRGHPAFVELLVEV